MIRFKTLLEQGNAQGFKIISPLEYYFPVKRTTDGISAVDIKFKKFPFWRIDKRHLQILDGGWHFSEIKTPEEIYEKHQNDGENTIFSLLTQIKVLWTT